MLLIASAMLAVTAPGASVGYQELVAGQEAAAIAQIQETETATPEDPAALINLGIAYARQGRIAEAQAMFNAAIDSDERYKLETASGDWVDSRHLARKALKMLAQGGFERPTRVATR